MPITITPDHPLVGRPTLTWAQAKRAYGHRTATGEYDWADVQAILGWYADLGCQVGLDPLVSVAQLCLETGWLTSDWAQRPPVGGRNPAGIGVTGEPGAGVRFPTWAMAARAHVGRLLAYALPAGSRSQQQMALCLEALSWRPLPAAKQGQAPTIEGLAMTWAMTRSYATDLCRVANQLLTA